MAKIVDRYSILIHNHISKLCLDCSHYLVFGCIVDKVNKSLP